jgi:exodeoxyribonuclease VII large subunit
MICGLDYFNSTKSKVDVIIIGRGGGSIEDLWAFNDERLARAVYASEIPIISAVGHETDFTICDFVADLRAPTPSAAAELAFPDIREINQQLYDIRCSLSEIIEDKISEAEELISFFSDDKIISLLENKYNRSKEKITELSSALHKNMSNILHSSEQALLLCSELLDANSPHRILSKGYSVVTDSEGNVVHGVDQVKINDKINVRMSDGSIVTEITSINRHITSDNK